MELVINGEIYKDIPKGINVAGLLEHLQLPSGKIAVERNLEIVPRSSFASQVLGDGDKLEIIHFIGGG